MGLFSNNKKLCPICGGPTPRLFSTKVEDMRKYKELLDLGIITEEEFTAKKRQLLGI